MKPASFDYERPETLDAALALMADTAREPAALAGGQSLMPMMNFRIARPGVLVDLNRVPGLSGISVSDGLMRIGAMTRYADLAASSEIAQSAPLIAKALPHIAHPAIRNRATLGGSLALADPAAEMPAVALALGAVLHVAGPGGTRDIPADDFFLAAYETALEPGELLVAASFPAVASAAYGFHEIARRHGDYALAGAAVARSDGTTRVALFGIGDGAVRARAAEAVLDRAPDDVDGAVSALDDLAITGDDAEARTRRHFARVALSRALTEMSA